MTSFKVSVTNVCANTTCWIHLVIYIHICVCVFRQNNLGLGNFIFVVQIVLFISWLHYFWFSKKKCKTSQYLLDRSSNGFYFFFWSSNSKPINLLQFYFIIYKTFENFFTVFSFSITKIQKKKKKTELPYLVVIIKAALQRVSWNIVLIDFQISMSKKFWLISMRILTFSRVLYFCNLSIWHKISIYCVFV